MIRALRPEYLRNVIEEVIEGCIELVAFDKISFLSKMFDDGRVVRNGPRNGCFPDTARTDEGYVRFSEDCPDHFSDEVIPPEE